MEVHCAGEEGELVKPGNLLEKSGDTEHYP